MFISIGVDCGMASFIKDQKKRHAAFPFDWTVSYNGISECIKDNFKEFIPDENELINKYGIYFHHDFKSKNREDDINKYTRRIERFQQMLHQYSLEMKDEYIIFCRKGHSNYHHLEHNCRFNNIKNDIEDAEELDIILSQQYPNLKYKIIVILVCEKCFDANKIYKSNSMNIDIYNISNSKCSDKLFIECATKIFNSYHLQNNIKT
jgi:hypothetical protein